MQGIDGGKLMTMRFGIQGHITVHVTHVMQRILQILTCLLGQQRIIHHRLLTDIPQRTVQPFRRVSSGHPIRSQGNLEQREPLTVGLLMDVSGHLRNVNLLGISLHPYLIQQILTIGKEFR